MVDSTIKAFVFTAGPPAGVSFAEREGNPRPWRGGVGGCVCVCACERRRRRRRRWWRSKRRQSDIFPSVEVEGERRGDKRGRGKFDEDDGRVGVMQVKQHSNLIKVCTNSNYHLHAERRETGNSLKHVQNNTRVYVYIQDAVKQFL